MKADQKVEAPAGGGSKKLIIIILAVVLVLGAAGGGAAWFFLHGKADAEDHDDAPAKKKKSKKAAGPAIYEPVEPFTVNLQPGESGADQYLQVAFSVQLPDAETQEEIKKNMAKVRSRVLLLLSSKHASDINTPEGKVQLAKDIIAALKDPFEDRGSPQEVEDVLFTSFIIQ
ncbi:flagellar basal body-associated protein FliL [Pseudoduganella sp. FT25W]|jgi:flagellar FliL protein|uniref:Flagellar protein FliL n=1 Tax=Duganella alba TaxID=2666081 RepID=A0A6L5QPY1_9BURK|nr:flagellar basal body-associated protein FliL [Duganella alba]MRX11924.1 flagellar basal body-associated protein FliL [Duganella alba]MRX20316.1 flagellar basal body-associated protein FliL [Duganella alba]